MVNITSVTGRTTVAALTTITSNVITNSSGSSTVDKLNNVILSNYTGTSVSANVIINRGSTVYYLGGAIVVPPNSTLVLLGKDTSVYLEEGDVLQANASANSSINFTASYELIS